MENFIIQYFLRFTEGFSSKLYQNQNTTLKLHDTILHNTKQLAKENIKAATKYKPQKGIC